MEGKCMIVIKITKRPIGLKDLEKNTNLESGCVNIFVGKVREISNKKRVKYLNYEAYMPMALSEMQKIADNAMNRFEINGITAYHRVGVVNTGEIPVIISVTSGHRRPAIQATQYIIDNIKTKVPIWKKEVYEDGEEWVSANP